MGSLNHCITETTEGTDSDPKRSDFSEDQWLQ